MSLMDLIERDENGGPSLRDTVADILRWRASATLRGLRDDEVPPDQRASTYHRLCDSSRALRWVAERERDMEERNLHLEIAQLREECSTLEDQREDRDRWLQDRDKIIARLEARIKELEGAST